MAILMERDIDIGNEVDTFFKRYNKQPINNDVGVIILKPQNDNIGKEKSYNIKIWGKSVIEWVKLAFDTCPIMELDYIC